MYCNVMYCNNVCIHACMCFGVYAHARQAQLPENLFDNPYEPPPQVWSPDRSRSRSSESSPPKWGLCRRHTKVAVLSEGPGISNYVCKRACDTIMVVNVNMILNAH